MPMDRFLAQFDQKMTAMRPAHIWIYSVLTTVGLGWLDYVTGYEISFSFFYLIPVFLVTWYISRRSGLIMALLTIVVWVLSNRLAGQQYSSEVIRIWNAILRLAFFALTVNLLQIVKATLDWERQLSRTDYLTGAVNSREFHQILQTEIIRSQRYHHPISLAYLDLDNFKTINDQFGHQAGDKVLQFISSTIRNSLRKVDTLARLGGDEFAILLPETNHTAAQGALLKVREAILSQIPPQYAAVTVSIGVVSFEHPPDSPEVMLHHADNLMYQVKSSGKNHVLFAEPDHEEQHELTQQNHFLNERVSPSESRGI